MPASLLDTARRMAAAALAAVDPERLVREELARSAGRFDSRFDGIIAVGKASAAMARGTRDILAAMAAIPSRGFSPRRLLVRPHSSPALLDPGWEQKTGGHPLPDRHSLAAGDRLLEWLSGIGEDQALLALVSGGSSACLEVPAAGLTLEDLLAAHRRLLASGLPIGEVNRERKRLSALKGGGALRAVRGRVLALVLSDVPGDDPATVGSGLFVPDDPEEGDPALDRLETVVLAGAGTAVDAAAATAKRLGFEAATGDLAGEAATVGRDLVARGRSLLGKAPSAAVALILGGETTVRLNDRQGRGGRNGELALAAARELSSGPDGAEEVVLAFATDGEDAATGTAGAVVDRSSWEAVRRKGMDPEAALAGHDSLSALEKVSGALLRTGVTGTNVGDLAIYLRREPRMG